jgi:hypothetical protein
MSAFDLPFADAVLKPHDIVYTGTTALVCIINEAEDFYKVSHDIIMAKFDDSYKGNVVTFDDLLESLVDMDAYCLRKAKKRQYERRSREVHLWSFE